MKPVYIINGFLESGKTEFICYTLDQPYFQIKGRTLLIVCEEGENEYGEKLLKKSRADIAYIEEEYSIEITQKDVVLYPMNTIAEIAEVIANKLD